MACAPNVANESDGAGACLKERQSEDGIQPGILESGRSGDSEVTAAVPARASAALPCKAAQVSALSSPVLKDRTHREVC